MNLSPTPAQPHAYGVRASGEAHGVVLTKPHVVELILDLAGYTKDRDLGALSLLEPACGHGAFVVAAARRLMESTRGAGRNVLDTAIRAYDIDESHVRRSREAAAQALRSGGVAAARARTLAETWIRHGDFLLAAQERPYDVVVGNPPYVRIEQIAASLQAEYRARFQSLYDRADLYIAFIEQGLNVLGKSGILAFVCADRWTLNKYGGPLRRLIADRFGVRCYIDLHRASPFESEVIAYPAIFAIGREKSARVHVASLARGTPEECARVVPSLKRHKGGPGIPVSSYRTWFERDEPWIMSSPEQLATLRELEKRFLPMEVDGRARVGIGVATGNDAVYIVDQDADIEADRLVPLVMRNDIENGGVRNRHRYVINTFRDDGGAIDLGQYPRLARYLDRHGPAVRKRHISRKNPASWFRTIDRVYPALVRKPKLLIPDIAGSNEVVFEKGRYHPHHGLYFVTSDIWDVEVLGGLLSSKVALFFVWSYAVKMRGEYLRFQAQYLRRIRLPGPTEIPTKVSAALREAFRARDFGKLDELALLAYGVKALPAFHFVDTRARA